MRLLHFDLRQPATHLPHGSEQLHNWPTDSNRAPLHTVQSSIRIISGVKWAFVLICLPHISLDSSTFSRMCISKKQKKKIKSVNCELVMLDEIWQKTATENILSSTYVCCQIFKDISKQLMLLASGQRVTAKQIHTSYFNAYLSLVFFFSSNIFSSWMTFTLCVDYRNSVAR